MKLQLLLLIACILGSNTYINAQNNSLVKYNFQSKTFTNISAISYDEAKTSDKTQSNIGLFNDQIDFLSLEIPTENLISGSKFRMKEIASNDFILQNYPIRTSVKTFAIVDGVILDGCSGSMVSNKHVISSAHCFESYSTQEILVDSVMICPVYDLGEIDPYFGCTYVTDVYVHDDWQDNHYDYALYKTEEEIGNQTGWIGIGYNEDDSYFEGSIGHKYSYPSKTIEWIDPRTYNGDTLYHSYGVISAANPSSLIFIKAFGIPGESGSSVIIPEEDMQFTSYGQLSWSTNLNHSRIEKGMFYAFKNILESPISQVDPEKNIFVSVFPNPTANQVNVTSDIDISQITVFNEVGVLIQQTSNKEIDLTSYPSGVYFLQIATENGIVVKKIIKQSL